jgi:Glycosyltransferase family 87
MLTIDRPLRVDSASLPKMEQPGKRSHLEFYLLGIGQALALVAFLSFCVMWVQWQTSTPGVSKVSGDFVSFWTAGRLALDGHAADAYREMPHYFKELAVHGDPSWDYVAFFYPPFFLLLCAGFALLSYLPALSLWLTTSCCCYALALRALVPKGLRDGGQVWLLFLGYPAVMVNAGFGQNGFLSTALLGGAAIWLDRRPGLAGVFLGCLAYKPQLGLVVPLALAAAGRWRCFAAAATTVLFLAAAATLAFGVGVWPAFIADLAVARRNWLEPFNSSYLMSFTTIYGAVRLHGGPLLLAYAVQGAVTVAAVFMLIRSLLRPGLQSGKAEVAAIAACVPFCSPFMLEYDLVILAVPMAWLVSEALRNGFRPGERSALLAAYAAPALFKVPLFDNALKLSVIAAAALLFAAVLRRGKCQCKNEPGLERASDAGQLQLGR